jgi:hypothetical protein
MITHILTVSGIQHGGLGLASNVFSLSRTRDDPSRSSIVGRGGEPVDIYQCPECELRFTNASEMDAHIKSDHPRFHEKWSSADDYLASEAHRRRRDRARGTHPRSE